MKSLIVYSSRTGNTYKLAHAFWQGIPGDKQIYSAEATPDPSLFDFVALAFWLNDGKPDQKSMQYLAKIGSKPLFLMATHGSAKGSAMVENALGHAKGLTSKAMIVGTYTTQGRVSPLVIERYTSMPDPPAWIADACAAESHPSQQELDELKAIAARISSTYQ